MMNVGTLMEAPCLGRLLRIKTSNFMRSIAKDSKNRSLFYTTPQKPLPYGPQTRVATFLLTTTLKFYVYGQTLFILLRLIIYTSYFLFLRLKKETHKVKHCIEWLLHFV